MHYYDGYGYGSQMMYGYGAFDFVWHALFIALIVVGVFMLFRMLRHGRKGGDWTWRGGHSALGILEERFAKGEIDKAEFEERRQALIGT